MKIFSKLTNSTNDGKDYFYDSERRTYYCEDSSEVAEIAKTAPTGSFIEVNSTSAFELYEVTKNKTANKL